MGSGMPTAGTAAHAFILAHRSERDAFEAQVAAQGPGTTLLVDTFDTEAGTELALDVAGPELGAIRIDSGDLADSSRRCRSLLDQRGATKVKITVTGDLDEFTIAELLSRDAPVDTFGVGTKLVSGYSPPGFVFKLVAIDDGTSNVGRPPARTSSSGYGWDALPRCSWSGAAAGGLGFGWLGDRLGRVRAMTLSILTYSIFTGLCFFAQEPWHLGALRFIAAFGMGGEWSLGVALVMEAWPSGKRALLAGVIGIASNAGYLLIALVGLTLQSPGNRGVGS